MIILIRVMTIRTIIKINNKNYKYHTSLILTCRDINFYAKKGA